MRNVLGTLLKWVGGATAILSLIFALYQATQLVADVRERQRNITELYKLGKLQQGAADYKAAWASFQQAANTADSGGQLAKLTGRLDERRRELREAQEDLAMEWLEDVELSKNQTYSDVVDPLVPVLTRGALSATGVRKGDLLAHIGWAYFLLSSDGILRGDPELQYRQALAIDPANPYAHVYWGYSILLWGEALEDARQHFSSAVASGRARPLVRRVEIAALYRRNGEDADAELLRVVNDMVKNNEKVEARARSHVSGIYYFAVSADRGNPYIFDRKNFRRLIAAVPATEQIAMIRALFYDADFDRRKIPFREISLAMLQEAAGLRDEALKTWRTLRSDFPTHPCVIVRADAAIKRLSQK